MAVGGVVLALGLFSLPAFRARQASPPANAQQAQAGSSDTAPRHLPLSPDTNVSLTNLPGQVNLADAKSPPSLPENPAELLNYGNEMLKAGNVPLAIRLYSKAMKLNPDDEEAHFSLAFAYLKAGQTNEAIKHYSDALTIFPDYVEAHNNLGNILVAQRRYDEAIEHFSASLKLMPENSSALNSLGRAVAEQGKTKEAIAHFSEAVRLNPSYLEARCNLGNALLTIGKTNEAIAEFTEVLHQNATFQPALRGLLRARSPNR